MNPQQRAPQPSRRPVFDVVPPSKPAAAPGPKPTNTDGIHNSQPPMPTTPTAHKAPLPTNNPIANSASQVATANAATADDAELDAILKEVKPDIPQAPHHHKSLFHRTKKVEAPLKAGAVVKNKRPTKPGAPVKSANPKPVMAITVAIIVAVVLCGAAIAAYHQS